MSHDGRKCRLIDYMLYSLHRINVDLAKSLSECFRFMFSCSDSYGPKMRQRSHKRSDSKQKGEQEQLGDEAKIYNGESPNKMVHPTTSP